MPTGLGDELVWYCPTINFSEPYRNLVSGPNLSPVDSSASHDLTYGEYDFEGSSDSYATNGTYYTVPNTTYSVATWIKSQPSSSEVDGAVSQSNINNRRGFLIGSYSNSSQGGNGSKLTHFYQSSPSSYDGNQRLQSNATVFDNTWHHVVVTFSGGSRTNIYVDGVLDNTTSSNVPSQVASVSVPFELGRYAGSGGINGSLDDIRVYDRVLSSSEAAYLASGRGIQGEPPPPPSADGLGTEIAWYVPTITQDSSDVEENFLPLLNNGASIVPSTGDGGSYAFSVSGGQIFYADGNQVITPAGTFSWAFWTKGSPSSSEIAGVVGNYNLSSNRRGPCAGSYSNSSQGGNPSKLHFFFQSSATSYNANQRMQSNATVFDNTWHHVVCQFNPSNWCRIYVDGVLDSTDTSSIPSSVNLTQRMELGRVAGSGNYTGQIDDFRVFDELLDQSQITCLASGRGVEGTCTQADAFFNPFKSQAFHTLTGKRIR